MVEMLHFCDYLILALDYKLHGGRNSPRLSNSKCHTRELLCGGGKNKSLLLSQGKQTFPKLRESSLFQSPFVSLSYAPPYTLCFRGIS